MNAQFDRHQWEHRVILLFANDGENASLQQQKKIIQSDRPGYQERDVKTYLVFTNSVSTLAGEEVQDLEPAKIREDYEVRPAEFRFVLIGKDGTVKMNESEPVDNQTLFKTIDAMPMRQREMRE